MTEATTETAQFPFTEEGNCAFLRELLARKYPQYAATLDWIDTHYHKRPYVSGEPVLFLNGAMNMAAYAAERIWN